MGSLLVSAALRPEWAGLTPTARVVLVTMCHTAKDRTRDDDTTRTRRYWGGVDYLIVCLVGDVEPGSVDYENARRRVRRAIAELEAAGAIEREIDAVARRRAAWRVTVEEPLLPVDSPVDSPVDTSATTSPRPTPGGHQRPAEPDTSVPLNGHQCPPERTPVSPLNRGESNYKEGRKARGSNSTKPGTPLGLSTTSTPDPVLTLLDAHHTGRPASAWPALGLTVGWEVRK